jgi:hypothetical protein
MGMMGFQVASMKYFFARDLPKDGKHLGAVVPEALCRTAYAKPNN